MKRQPKSVKGDGTSTVRQLVEAANAAELKHPTWSRKKPSALDDAALAWLRKAGVTSETVLSDGQLVALRPFTSEEWGSSAEEVT